MAVDNDANLAYLRCVMLLLESLPTVIGTAAVAPALLFLWLVIATDERPGPPLRVWSAFFLGAASISLLGLARAPFSLYTLPLPLGRRRFFLCCGAASGCFLPQ